MCLLLAWSVCGSAQAQAVVRKCQIEGRIVFQSSPCPIEAQLASSLPSAVPATPPQTEIASSAKKKKTLADLLRERDGPDRGRVPQREPQVDGASVLPSRMGAV